VSRRSVLRTRPQRERDRKFADSARSQFEATQEEVQPASARDFSMSRENPAISCSSSPSAASDEPRKPPLQVLHEELLPLPSTDGTLQLRTRWFAPARVEGLSAVADERCRTDKLDRAIKRRSSRETTMVGRGATLDGRLFLGGTDGSNPVPSSAESGANASLAEKNHWRAPRDLRRFLTNCTDRARGPNPSLI